MRKIMIILLFLFAYRNCNCQDLYRMISMSFATGNAQKDEWNWDEFSEIKGTIALQHGTVVINAGKEVTYLKVGKLLMSKNIGTALAVTWEATDQNNMFCFFKKVVDPNAKYDRYSTYYGNIAFCWRTEQHKITY